MSPEAFANEFAQWMFIAVVLIDWSIRRTNAMAKEFREELRDHFEDQR